MDEDPTRRLLTQWLPSRRFERAPETIFDGSHDKPAHFDGEALKILSWNVAKSNHDRRFTREFLSILEREQPDIVFLQEVRVDAETMRAVDLAGMHWSVAPNYKDTHLNAYSGLLTAARPAPIGQRVVLTHDTEPLAGTPKASLLTEYPLPGRSRKLLAINSHLINFVDLPSFGAQLRQLEAIASRHRGPMVLAGDFNTWNAPRVELLEEIARRLGLKAVTFAPADRWLVKRFLLSAPLDNIFFRGLSEKANATRVLRRTTCSDHRPILTELTWDEETD
ncbi:endonuclease/exonuclease/phosphatase family protein [Gloeobacter violaceus]|uniref:Gll4079 protein n=1 Tax=Gloeobacter violaceus (strain ATCC 29082 / PCC 7421) TaxID=251221 RepID=Q7NE03_GLOVI|nr:endonuclease/exonuclease/phosphatase family protein [Gloeobacter violaceus]BAC92020.1 gll4079 [Gloeobacter violaceus PCC 7421]